MTKLTWLLVLLLVSGCVAVPDSADEAALRERRNKPEVHASLVEAMLSQGQNHAALAHIEELERKGQTDSEQLRYLRAQAEYKLGDFAAAQDNFIQLLQSGFAAQAWHGLGLISARSDLRLAVQQLNRAVSARPTDARIRNDLGYTLMQAGRLTEARHHLATATELDANAVQAKSNLVLSFLVDAQDARARALASSFQLTAEQWRQLQAESQIVRRLISERATELTSASQAEPFPEMKHEQKHDQKPQFDDLPGLYRSRR